MMSGGERTGVNVPPGPREHPVDPARIAHARARGISAEDASRLAGTPSLFADPVRARVLYALELVEELCVGDIAWRSARPRTRSGTD